MRFFFNSHNLFSGNEKINYPKFYKHLKLSKNMRPGKYNLKPATSHYYQLTYGSVNPAREIFSASIPYQTSSQTTYRLSSGSLGMSGSYS